MFQACFNVVLLIKHSYVRKHGNELFISSSIKTDNLENNKLDIIL